MSIQVLQELVVTVTRKLPRRLAPEETLTDLAVLIPRGVRGTLGK